MINSFFSKLSVALLTSFVLMAIALVYLIQDLTADYQDEVQQKLHANLAELIVSENQLLLDNKMDLNAVKQSFKNMMVLGPSFEFYLLDTKGKLLAYSADPAKMKRDSVSLRPVKYFLSGQKSFPIFGDDPRSKTKQKIISVAKIESDSQGIQGYLYVIIGSEISDNIGDLLINSHILKLSLGTVITGLIFSALIILTLFALLTQPLKRLTQEMAAFRKKGFERGELEISNWDANSRDEVHHLGVAFREMAITLKEQYKKLQTTDQMRREMVSYVSHDLRTPLASLQGYLETWLLKKDELSKEESEHYISIAKKNAQQLSQLVEQLFELAQLDNEAETLSMEPISIAELAQDVLQKFQLKAKEKSVTLDVSPKDPSLEVIANIAKLERVLTNLVDNSIRHCDAEDTVLIQFKHSVAGVEVSVKDTGIGIPADELAHIFDPHYRARNSIAQQRSKSGLGLAIAKRIIELHGAHIQVESELNVGTSFKFTLQNSANERHS